MDSLLEQQQLQALGAGRNHTNSNTGVESASTSLPYRGLGHSGASSRNSSSAPAGAGAGQMVNQSLQSGGTAYFLSRAAQMDEELQRQEIMAALLAQQQQQRSLNYLPGADLERLQLDQQLQLAQSLQNTGQPGENRLDCGGGNINFLGRFQASGSVGIITGQDGNNAEFSHNAAAPQQLGGIFANDDSLRKHLLLAQLEQQRHVNQLGPITAQLMSHQHQQPSRRDLSRDIRSTFPRQQHNRVPLRVPCCARDMPLDHNFQVSRRKSTNYVFFLMNTSIFH